MAHDTLRDAVEALDALLEEERTVLLSGDLDSLSDLLGRKEALMDQMGRLAANQDDVALSDVQAKLRRNQALLDSALAGIRSVARRLATVRRVRQSLEFYDEDGARASVDIGIERSVEKRA